MSTWYSKRVAQIFSDENFVFRISRGWTKTGIDIHPNGDNGFSFKRARFLWQCEAESPVTIVGL